MALSFDRFVGKVAVVTGTSSGIGKAIAIRLVKEGLIVAGLARRVERVNELAKELKNEKGKLYGFKCDVTKENEIKSTFAKIIKELGNIHILVNNAGVLFRSATLTKGDSEVWKKTLDTNVLGLCIATKEAIQNMKENSISGHIVHINSVGGHEIFDFAALNVYGASKFAVTALTEQLRKELNSEKLPIKITSVSPGGVETELGDSTREELLKYFKDLPPKLAAEDVAEAVAYTLATPPTVNVKEIILWRVGTP